MCTALLLATMHKQVHTCRYRHIHPETCLTCRYMLHMLCILYVFFAAKFVSLEIQIWYIQYIQIHTQMHWNTYIIHTHMHCNPYTYMQFAQGVRSMHMCMYCMYRTSKVSSIALKSSHDHISKSIQHGWTKGWKLPRSSRKINGTRALALLSLRWKIEMLSVVKPGKLAIRRGLRVHSYSGFTDWLISWRLTNTEWLMVWVWLKQTSESSATGESCGCSHLAAQWPSGFTLKWNYWLTDGLR